MAKKEKQTRPAAGKESDIIPVRYQHAAAILVILVALVLFFREIVFDGKVFAEADTIASQSFKTYVQDAKDQGIFPLWNPYIFCGMPAYASLTVSGERAFDVTALVLGWSAHVFAILTNNLDVGWELFYYLLFGIGMYMLAFDKVRSKVAALVAALGTVFSMYVVVLVMVGHMTKVPVLAFFPFIFLLLERLREKFSFFYSLALIVLVHFMLLPSHMQMILYVYLALGLYYLYFLIYAIAKKEPWLGLIRSGLILGAATAIALAMTGDQYLSTLEYAPYSTRGSDPIVQNQQKDGAKEAKLTKGGLDYDYATSWSFSPGETFTFLIPSLYGFGGQTYQGILSQNQPIRVNTYFGQMPFTDAPQYMGIVILVLAVIGVVRNRKNPFVQYLVIASILALIISYGRELPILFDLMFKYFPMFNKFRIPSMILIIVQMFVPLLATYGIASLAEDAKGAISASSDKKWKIAFAVMGVLLVIALALRDVITSIYAAFFPEQEITQVLARSYGNQSQVLSELYKFIAGGVATDIAAAMFVLLVAFGAFYLYRQRMVKYPVLAAAIILAVIVDLWRVGSKPMTTHDKRATESALVAPGFVKFIQRDPEVFRTLEFENGAPPYNNLLAYWRIQSAYGYQGAKIRAYQDVVDVVGLGNPLLWGLMNVKYIVSNRPDSNEVMVPIYREADKMVFYNRASMPRTFFVDRYEVAGGIDILNRIKSMSFNPRQIAFVMEDPHLKIDPPQPGSSAQFIRSGIQDLEMKVNATGNNLLFVSETYYPEGWKAFVDNVETPILKLNYLFRGVVVPAGVHTVTMKFQPHGFALGKTMSLGFNILVLLGFAALGAMEYLKKRKAQPV
ncbi:MAG: YfhO family protein, partial [Ignavibacteriales bacterium]|nr:YfhO family protein [Ignavibacteriales bacterium]